MVYKMQYMRTLFYTKKNISWSFFKKEKRKDYLVYLTSLSILMA